MLSNGIKWNMSASRRPSEYFCVSTFASRAVMMSSKELPALRKYRIASECNFLRRRLNFVRSLAGRLRVARYSTKKSTSFPRYFWSRIFQLSENKELYSLWVKSSTKDELEDFLVSHHGNISKFEMIACENPEYDEASY